MLDVLNLSHLPAKTKLSAEPVLQGVSLALPPGHVLGIVGAAGSGKSMLIRLLAGLELPTTGTLRFQGHDTAVVPVHPNQIALVAATDEGLSEVLTVRESLMSAHFLRVGGQTNDARTDRVSHLLVGVGLEMVAAHRVSTLSLAQRRRLKLAIALVSDAPLVLCDEFADGVDVKSAQELVALLKWVVSDLPGRIVIHASQTLGNLASYDSVLVLHEGHVCFHGPSRAVAHYFSITTVEELYPRLAKRPADRWGESWSRHRVQYYEAFQLGDLGEPAEQKAGSEPGVDGDGLEDDAETAPEAPKAAAKPEVEPSTPLPLPSFMGQTLHLMRRRWTLWRRTQREWLEYLALLLVCPLAAMLLMAPNTGYMSEIRSENHAPEVLWPAAYTCAMILWVQVLLIMVVSLRLATREIAGERVLFERERIAGLRGLAYLVAKLGFLTPLMIAQGLALVLLTDLMGGHLPGNDGVRLVLLVLSGVAFGSLCLAISAWACSVDRAQSHAWKLWAANVLLAGAILGFPRPMGFVLQPFMTAYYGWSGSVDTLSGFAVFEPMTHFVRTWFATPWTAVIALMVHSVTGIVLAAWGLRKRQ
ncbi:MAG: ATP-binding cassette domain-containing protein [Verrucomicrobiota bacterium]